MGSGDPISNPNRGLQSEILEGPNQGPQHRDHKGKPIREPIRDPNTGTIRGTLSGTPIEDPNVVSKRDPNQGPQGGPQLGTPLANPVDTKGTTIKDPIRDHKSKTLQIATTTESAILKEDPN